MQRRSAEHEVDMNGSLHSGKGKQADSGTKDAEESACAASEAAEEAAHFHLMSDIPLYFKNAVYYRLNDQGKMERCDKLKRTAIHYACSHGRLDVVQGLMKLGVDIDQKDAGLYTPLRHAIHGIASKGHDCHAVVEFLVRAGCSVNSLDEECMTALDTALQDRESGVITQMLLGGCQLQKSLGHVYYRDHVANNVVVSLLLMGDFENAGLLILGGHVTPAQMRLVVRCLPMDQDKLGDKVRHLMFQPLSLWQSSCIAVRRHVMRLNEELPKAPSFVTMLKRFCQDLPKVTQQAVIGLGYWKDDQ